MTGARLEAIAAWQWPVTWGTALPLPEGFDPAADAWGMVDGVVERVAGEYPDIAIDRRVEEGHAAVVLVGRSADAALLVVGSRGHGEFTGMLLGSVSQHCAANAKCPVLVHRRPDSD
jgi:nucleotide-binding universal stress UspA family protein